ncbi:SUKH-4 family immunity protein [Actinoallomurus soli]|uniref:SUKH-4 family immunity protein n=1 Tax=Actinoallomurus soli TaxID=2952535 RepID=UPI002092C4D1|nr:SUKH-4 family immunity protein [Actinoallomurus soli]MCO5973079.1 SUKH-4 family immunity protein [Actinoallomurus soli]
MRVTVEWQRVIDTEPQGALVRFRREFAQEVWSDPVDLRFATEVGVCHSDGLFRAFTSLIERDPQIPEGCVTERDDVPEPVDTPKGRLQQLGWMMTGRTFVNLNDGTVWHSDPDQAVDYELINSDLSSLAYVLYKVMAEAPTRREELPSPDDWEEAENIVRADTQRWDPVPFSDPDGFWSRYLDEYQLYY